MKKTLFLVVGLLILTTLACGFNASTANISGADMSKDPDGNELTTTFAQDDIFYAVVELSNAPDDTRLKASWVAVDADGIDANYVIDEAELTSGSGTLQFDLTNDKFWPTGNYKVDLYLNDELDRSLTFEVAGEVAAVEPEPDPTDTPKPVEPDPTDTPEPEEPDPTDTPQTSTGDSLGGGASAKEPTPLPTEEEIAAEVLPLADTPYVHPSGAFSFAVPKRWELYDEDELSGSYGDDQSRVGAVFVNMGGVLNSKEMEEFVNDSMDILVGTFSDEYEIAAENNLLEENGLYYVGVTFSEDDGWADFFFEQQDTVVYVFYFTSLSYDAMEPTWDAIIDSYEIDADAALAASADDTAELAAPTAPPPTAAPPSNPFKPPAGVARVFMQNEYGSEYNVDFGDGSGSIAVMPGAQNFYHDVAPGKYNPGLSLPGGGATNVEFEIAPDQAWVILVTADLSVKWGQVYP